MFQVGVEPRLEEICCNLRVVVLWSIAGPLELCNRQVLGLGSRIGALRCTRATRSLAPMSVGQNAPVRSTLRGQCIKHASLLCLWYARHSKAAGHCTGRKHQGPPGCAFEDRWSFTSAMKRLTSIYDVRRSETLSTNGRDFTSGGISKDTLGISKDTRDNGVQT